MDNTQRLNMLARFEKMISDHGVAVIATEYDSGIPFAYTAGLERQGLPELFIVGLPPEVAQGIFNSLYASKTVNKLKAGVVSNDVFGNGVEAMPVKADRNIVEEMLTVSKSLAKGSGPLSALQIVYPDANGLWPWEFNSKVSDVPVFGER